MEDISVLQQFLLCVAGICLMFCFALALGRGIKDDDDFGGMA